MPHQQNVEKILQKLSRKEPCLKVTETALKRISLHPDYPNISSLLDTLEEYKVSTMAVKLQAHQLGDISYPAIAYCQEKEEQYFVLLQNISHDKVEYYDTDKGDRSEPLEDFQQKWQGITVLLAIDAHSGEANYAENLKQERLQKLENYLIYGILAVVFFLGLGFSKTWTDASLWLMLSIGSAVSTLLLIHEFGNTSPLINKICHIHKSTNCDAVLASRAAKLMGWVSFSEIGMLYFAGSQLALLFAGQNPFVHSFLFLLNGLALPYILFSVYYQAYILKQWCVLCLVVQAVLLAEFMIFILSDTALKDIQNSNDQLSALIAVAFLLPVSFWLLLKYYLKNSKNATALEKENIFYKRNSELFLAMLAKQKSADMDELPNEIILGNREGTMTLTMVSSPFCKPCAVAHREVTDLLDFYGDELKVVIRFIGKRPEQQQVITDLLNLAESDQISEALHDWFESRNYEKWSKKYSPNIAGEEYARENPADAWAEETGIAFTPAFFIDGKQLMPPYTIQDLKYHMRTLAENTLKTT